MKLAVIDCGTNTFNLIIIDLKEDRSYKKLFNSRIPVRLGEATINEGFISEIPFGRGIDAINTFSRQIKDFEVEKVIAFATSAIREASNGNDFVKKVASLFGISITVIDGNREAELIYLAIREAIRLGPEPSLIMDIGGGSNEFIIASKDRIYWKESFMIGAARLLERFPHSSPVTTEEKKRICSYLRSELEPLFSAVRQHRPVELIGSSGAFESIVEMINGELGGEAMVPEKTEYLVDLADNERISELVFSSDVEGRKKIKGLVPMRFDMIVISCLTVNFILESFHFKQLRVSTFSLKEGALIDYINNLELKR